MTAPEVLKIEHFSNHIGDAFSIDVDDHHIQLDLTECSELKHGPHDGNPETRHPFRLLFKGEGQPQLTQGTFLLKHKSLGDLAIFLVPIATGTYEAVFN